MLKVVSELHEKFGLEVLEQESASKVLIQRGELVFELTIPHTVFEWFVSAKEKTSGKEIWSDWMEQYDNTRSHLENEMQHDILRFVERLLKSEVRIAPILLFPQEFVPEWNIDGCWERIELCWE